MQHEYLKEEVKKINDGIGITEKIILGERPTGNGIGLSTDPAFKVLQIKVIGHEDDMCDEDMKQFFLDLRIDENFVRNVGQSGLLVDITRKPVLRDQKVHRPQRNHVLSLKLAATAHTLLIRLSVPQLR
jgi:hypothetical protein